MLDVDSSTPHACRSFDADIWSLDGTTKVINYKYEPVVTIKHVRQTCRLKKPPLKQEKYIDYFQTDENFEDERESKRKTPKHKKVKEEDSFRVSPFERTSVTFEFKNYPEFILEFSHLIINDSGLKAFGIITKVN